MLGYVVLENEPGKNTTHSIASRPANGLPGAGANNSWRAMLLSQLFYALPLTSVMRCISGSKRLRNERIKTLGPDRLNTHHLMPLSVQLREMLCSFNQHGLYKRKKWLPDILFHVETHTRDSLSGQLCKAMRFL